MPSQTMCAPLCTFKVVGSLTRSATAHMYGQQPWFTKDCELLERTYDRCSHGYINVSYTDDEKIGVWEALAQNGADTYQLVLDSREISDGVADLIVKNGLGFQGTCRRLLQSPSIRTGRSCGLGSRCDRYIEELSHHGVFQCWLRSRRPSMLQGPMLLRCS